MQYLTTRNGSTDWVSDGAASDEAIDAALLSELARRIGMDWHEADTELQNHAPDDDEAQAATEQARACTDNDIVRALLRMIAARRAEMVRFQAARLMHMTARDLMEPAK